MHRTLTIARKELRIYLSSATALVFMGAFLLLTLFVFFWVDAFWSRGLADVRPLFSRMPLLLLVLVSALTMRQWSEEQRSGTQEILLTLPVRRVELVLGKLLAVVALVALTLLLTLFLPISISFLGNQDWGPVVGGYSAALLLASAYGAIGLLVSSRTDNQIVAFVVSMLLCGAFYIIGAPDVSHLGGRWGELLSALSTSRRFESIQRGVIDLRDLIYYLTLTGVFVAANVLSLHAKTWSQSADHKGPRRGVEQTAMLVMANLVLLNVWLAPLNGLRWDLTQQREFTLSSTTRTLLQGLDEPLEISAFVSERTHPLLAPLRPQLEDMLHEYGVAGGRRVRIQVLDPASNADAEADATNTYGIRSTPFQVAGRNETSIINAYFDVVVRYGDQIETLGFEDLVEVTGGPDGSVEVRLDNLEYQLTGAARRAVYGFQSVSTALAALTSPAELTLYVTPSTLPDWLLEAPNTIERVVAEVAGGSPNLIYRVVDLDAADADVSTEELYEQYGMQPVRASLFTADAFYLHLVLQSGDSVQIIYPGGDYAESEVRTTIESAIKRSAPGFLQVVGLWTPTANTELLGQQPNSLSTYYELEDALMAEYQVRHIDLSTGQVAGDVDVLLLIAPQGLSEVERFAVDQYLMRGGAVVAAAGNYGISIDPVQGGLALQSLEAGLRELLLNYGIDVQQALVLDRQNEPFPVTVNRQVGQYTVRELQAMDYPFFVDVRSDGMTVNHPAVSGLSAVTLNWASPVMIDAEANAGRKVTALLRSSEQSWLQTETNINPNYDLYPETGFRVAEQPQAYDLAVAVTGVFGSAFAATGAPAQEDGSMPDAALVETSPDTARLVVLGSAEFANDTVFAISAQLAADRHLNSIQLVQNAIAWCVDDEEMLQIRSRGSATRLLAALSPQGQRLWEGLNYGVVLAGLLAIGVTWRARLCHEEPLPLPARTGDAPNQTQGGQAS